MKKLNEMYVVDLEPDEICSGANITRELLGIIESRSIEDGHKQSDEKQKELCDRLHTLITQVDLNWRRRVATILASLNWISHKLAVLLAQDEIDVACEILLRSPVLQDVDLVEIVRRKGFEYRLVIAERPKIGADVSDALAMFAESEVITKLVRNQNAEIGASTLDHLISVSRHCTEYIVPLLERAELTTDSRRILLNKLGSHLTHQLSGRFDHEARLFRSVIKFISDQMDDRQGPRLLEIFGAAVRKDGRVAISLLEAGEVRLFFHVIACWSGLPVDQVEYLFSQNNLKIIEILCRSLNFESQGYLALVCRLQKASKDAIIIPDEQEIIKSYRTMSGREASSVLDRWKRDGLGFPVSGVDPSKWGAGQ